MPARGVVIARTLSRGGVGKRYGVLARVATAGALGVGVAVRPRRQAVGCGGGTGGTSESEVVPQLAFGKHRGTRNCDLELRHAEPICSFAARRYDLLPRCVTFPPQTWRCLRAPPSLFPGPASRAVAADAAVS